MAVQGDRLTHEFDLNQDRPHRPRALALGPDGCMWMASGTRSSLLRITPSRVVREFHLLPGDKAGELVPTRNGLLFTIGTSNRLGFIRLLPAGQVPGAPLPVMEPGESWRNPTFKPRPARKKKLSQAQAQALHGERMRRAMERQEARREEAAAAARQGSQATALPAAEEAKTRVPAIAEAGNPSLAELGVYATPEDLRHIWNGHAHGRNPGKSQFAPEYSTQDALEALLAKGLAESGAIGRIVDQRGRCHTKCREPGVGRYHNHGDLVPTDHFLVVTMPYENTHLGGTEHGLITAYPVFEHW